MLQPTSTGQVPKHSTAASLNDFLLCLPPTSWSALSSWSWLISKLAYHPTWTHSSSPAAWTDVRRTPSPQHCTLLSHTWTIAIPMWECCSFCHQPLQTDLNTHLAPQQIIDAALSTLHRHTIMSFCETEWLNELFWNRVMLLNSVYLQHQLLIIMICTT